MECDETRILGTRADRLSRISPESRVCAGGRARRPQVPVRRTGAPRLAQERPTAPAAAGLRVPRDRRAARGRCGSPSSARAAPGGAARTRRPRAAAPCAPSWSAGRRGRGPRAPSPSGPRPCRSRRSGRGAAASARACVISLDQPAEVGARGVAQERHALARRGRAGGTAARRRRRPCAYGASVSLAEAQHLVALGRQRQRLRRVVVGEQQVAAAFGQPHHRVVHVERDQPALQRAEALAQVRSPSAGRT